MPQSDKNTPEWFRFVRIDTVFLVLLLMTTFLSAFCAYQASVWSGVQSAKYQEATELRTESVRAFNDGNTKLLIDLNVFMTWADAVSQNDASRASAIANRFTPEFKPAFKAWITQDPERPKGTIPNGTPFTLPEYRIEARAQGVLLENNANAAYNEAQNASDISTRYVMTTLLCAIVLFLCGVGERWEDHRFRKLILGTALFFFTIALALFLWLPKHF
jgi:hypothetical protein